MQDTSAPKTTESDYNKADYVQKHALNPLWTIVTKKDKTTTDCVSKAGGRTHLQYRVGNIGHAFIIRLNNDGEPSCVGAHECGKITHSLNVHKFIRVCDF
jgi:hypothetical protein